MSRYYFDTRDGDVTKDEIGFECEDMIAVHRMALIWLADLSGEIVARAESREVAVEVRDEEDNLVTQIGVRLETRLH